MKKEQKKHTTLIGSFEEILRLARAHDQLPVRSLITILTGRGYAVLLILLSLPFCFPINVPGLSTPFGIFLAFIGVRMAFAKRPWWPKWFLEKNISSERLIKLITKATVIINKFKKVLHPRLTFMVDLPIIQRLNGILITLLALLLAVPFPIPMTNILSALPIFMMGLGKLEDDGLAVLISYVMALFSFVFFMLIFLFGKSIFYHLTQ